jgi:exonuclease III
VKIVSWNIRAGGGKRAAQIVEQLERWRPSLVVLCEFRGTPPSRFIASRLAGMGLVHQRSTISAKQPAKNALLIASRSPLRLLTPVESPREPCRWLSVRVSARVPLVVGAMHIPNRDTGRKYPFHDAVLSVARKWKQRPAMLVGDTNTGWPQLDEEVPCFGRREQAFMESIEALGWADAFRQLRGRRRAYTWYSPNAGNGFRLDQAFLNPALQPRLTRASYVWAGGRAGGISDHAAILVELSEDLIA